MATGIFAGNVGSTPTVGVGPGSANWNMSGVNWDIIHRLGAIGNNGVGADIGAAHAYYDRMWQGHPYGQDGHLSPAQWLQQNLPEYVPNIVVGAIDNAYFDKTGVHLNQAQRTSLYQKMYGPGGLNELTHRIASSIYGVVSGTDYSQANSGGEAMGYADILKAISGYGPLGDALGGDIASGVGLRTGVAGVGGSTGGTLSPVDYASQQEDYSIAAEYLKATGRNATPGLIAKIKGMNETDRSNFYLNQTYKNGLTVQQWNNAKSRVDKLYMQYFGRNATDQEITWANGKSDADLNQHIMQSPSNVSGLNVGQYVSYRNMLDNISQDEFGRPADDTLVSSFHNFVNQK